MPTTTSSTTDTGTPRMRPPPSRAITGSCKGTPVTCVPPDRASAKPRNIQLIAGVPINDGMPMT